METWKILPSAPTYEVSNKGRVRHGSLILSQYPGTKGEMMVKTGSCRCRRVHRLVYESFFGSIPSQHDIHHKNNDNTDNRPENLELLSHGEHTRRGWKLGQRDGNKKPVLQFNKFGWPLKVYESAEAGDRAVHIRRGSVGRCCGGFQKTAGGYIWEYAV